MDALLLPAFLLVCLIVLILIPPALLYIIPVHSRLTFIVRDQTLFETCTITWGFIGIGITSDPERTRITVLAGRHPVTTFIHDGKRTTGGGEDEEEEIPARVPPSRETIASPAHNLIHTLEPLGSLFWKESRFAGADGKITLGLGDPALTGMCYGSYWASRFVLESFRIHIEMEPVFDREVFACDIAIRMILRHPLLFIIAAARILMKPATRDIISRFRERSPGAAPA